MRNVGQSMTPLHDSYKKPKVNTPDTFNGEWNKLTNFLMQVNLVFKLQPRRYVTDTLKIYYVTGYLWGAPETSIKSYLSLPEDRMPDLLKDFSKFEEYLKNTWGNPDKRCTAATKIYKIRQTGSSALLRPRRSARPLLAGLPLFLGSRHLLCLWSRLSVRPRTFQRLLPLARPGMSSALQSTLLKVLAWQRSWHYSQSMGLIRRLPRRLETIAACGVCESSLALRRLGC